MGTTQFAMVEELASIVKDNLRSKHLVLSMEETFINHLQPQDDSSSCVDDVLELEPMDPYNRLLLHRLADIFGFAHVSIGDGDDRHLVLKRCPETAIPSILVSDILSHFDNDPQAYKGSHQLLRREYSTALESSAPSTRTFEEREAAYMAARRRIFADEIEEPIRQKPRAVPVVARRMIAHALGQKLRNGENLGDKEEALSEKMAAVDLNGTQESSCERNKNGAKVVSKSGSKNEFSKDEHVGAAKRMFANALRLPSRRN